MNCHLIALHEAVGRSTLGGGFHRGGCGGSDGWVIGALEPRRAGGYISPITHPPDLPGVAAGPAEMIIAARVRFGLPCTLSDAAGRQRCRQPVVHVVEVFTRSRKAQLLVASFAHEQ